MQIGLSPALRNTKNYVTAPLTGTAGSQQVGWRRQSASFAVRPFENLAVCAADFPRPQVPRKKLAVEQSFRNFAAVLAGGRSTERRPQPPCSLLRHLTPTSCSRGRRKH